LSVVAAEECPRAELTAFTEHQLVDRLPKQRPLSTVAQLEVGIVVHPQD
jgi:hypothetical protein